MESSCTPRFLDVEHVVVSWLISFEGLPHMATHDGEYNGYFIPAGTTIVGNTWFVFTSAVIPPMPDIFLYPGQFSTIQKCTRSLIFSTQTGFSISQVQANCRPSIHFQPLLGTDAEFVLGATWLRHSFGSPLHVCWLYLIFVLAAISTRWGGV